MDIDVLGSYNTLKATLPYLVHSAAAHRSNGLVPNPNGTGGRIIFISATIHYTTMPLQTHVSVAKAGVDALSHSTALELGPRGLTSNVIAPGPIAGTEGMERLSRSEDAAGAESQVPVGRWGRVKEIADGTVYLFADTGNFVSGQTLVSMFDPSSPCCHREFLFFLAFLLILRQSTAPPGGILAPARAKGSSIPISSWLTRLFPVSRV